MSKKKWTLKGKLMLFKISRRTHTLRYKGDKTLLIILFDDRAVYSYIEIVPQYKEMDKIYRLRNEPVMIRDCRTGRDYD